MSCIYLSLWLYNLINLDKTSETSSQQLHRFLFFFQMHFLLLTTSVFAITTAEEQTPRKRSIHGNLVYEYHSPLLDISRKQFNSYTPQYSDYSLELSQETGKNSRDYQYVELNNRNVNYNYQPPQFQNIFDHTLSAGVPHNRINPVVDRLSPNNRNEVITLDKYVKSNDFPFGFGESLSPFKYIFKSNDYFGGGPRTAPQPYVDFQATREPYNVGNNDLNFLFGLRGPVSMASANRPVQSIGINGNNNVGQPPLAFGSGSLGIARLNNGKFAIGSGSLGYAGVSPGTTKVFATAPVLGPNVSSFNRSRRRWTRILNDNCFIITCFSKCVLFCVVHKNLQKCVGCLIFVVRSNNLITCMSWIR